MYRYQLTLCAVYVIAINALLYGQEPDWPYEEKYDDNMVYIHAIANYSLHPYWIERWENNAYRRNMLRLNFASISSTELFSDARLVLNERISPGLWFRYEMTYQGSFHRTEQDKYYKAGFEKKIYKNLSAYIVGNPHFEKENIDVEYGVSLTWKNRSNYMRLGTVDVDVFWDDKNNLHSTSIQKPYWVVWESNVRLGRWRVYSRGKYDSGYKRQYDPTISHLGRYYQDKKINDYELKLTYYRTPESFFQLSYSYYNYVISAKYENQQWDSSFNNEYRIYMLSYITPLAQTYRVRTGVYRIFQESLSTYYRAHTYFRQETIPFAFLERKIGHGLLEVGYMVTFHHWNYEEKETPDRFSRDDYLDKIKLAYTFTVGEKMAIQFSVSHVTTIWGFGGGNVQFWLTL